MTEDEERDEEERRQWRLVALGAALGAVILARMARAARESCKDGHSAAVEGALLWAWVQTMTEAWGATAREVAQAVMESLAGLDDDAWARGAVREARTRGIDKIDPDGVIWEQVPAERAAIRAGVARLNDSLSFYADDLRLRLVDGRDVDLREWWQAALRDSTVNVEQGTHFMRESMYNMARRMEDVGGVRVMRNGRSYDIEGFCRQRLRDEWAMCRQAQRDALGRELGMDAIEISAHAQCAPDHLPYQGRIYTRQEWARIEATLERPLGMYNCRHVASPCFSIDTPANDAAQLKAMRDASLREVELPDGRTCTAYEFTQWQRQQERRVRGEERDARVMRELGVTDEANRHKARAKAITEAYEAASEAAGIRTRSEALRLGRMVGTSR